MPGAPSRSPFSYLILRAVPSLERGKRVNVGVVLFCRQRELLSATAEVAPARLATLGGDADPAKVGKHLAALVRVAEGAEDARPIAALPASERLGWPAAPASTIPQPCDIVADRKARATAARDEREQLLSQPPGCRIVAPAATSRRRPLPASTGLKRQRRHRRQGELAIKRDPAISAILWAEGSRAGDRSRELFLSGFRDDAATEYEGRGPDLTRSCGWHLRGALGNHSREGALPGRAASSGEAARSIVIGSACPPPIGGSRPSSR